MDFTPSDKAQEIARRLHRFMRDEVEPLKRTITAKTLFRINTDRLALIVTDPTRSTSDFRLGLQARFGLTETEADLVNDLIHGETVRNFADTHKIVCETARTHLKNAMSKNGWHRQGEMLVEVLGNLLPAGMFHPDRA